MIIYEAMASTKLVWRVACVQMLRGTVTGL